MKRIDLYITTNQDSALRDASKQTGLSVSEIVRRMVDNWIANKSVNSA